MLNFGLLYGIHIRINNIILNFIHVLCSFSLLTIFIVFFVFVNLLRRFASPKENEPKETALSRQVFFKDI